ncbi:MAG: chemotaxis protein [Desulfuromonadaceae bacterium GWC2_58_13]|nr:MAG: chemotaxis protein [Desulfuromonadaceae bacterium GWC2_58_13]
MKTKRKPIKALMGCLVLLVLAGANPALAEEPLSGLDAKVKELADQCAREIITQYELLLTSGHLTTAQLFDTFYIPVAGTEPQKFHTQYDELAAGIIRPILDKFLELDDRFEFVVVVDRNGYLPAHNTRYSKPLSGDRAADAQWNREKRLFNDRAGLAAARNSEPYLLQRYSRDTGESMSDISVPIMVQGRHWGAVRIAYH